MDAEKDTEFGEFTSESNEWKNSYILRNQLYTFLSFQTLLSAKLKIILIIVKLLHS